MTDFTTGFRGKTREVFEDILKKDDTQNKHYKLANELDKNNDNKLSDAELNAIFDGKEAQFNNAYKKISEELFPNISDRVLSIFVDRLLGLDSSRKDQQDEISAIAARIDLISRAQGKVKDKINLLTDDKDTSGRIDNLEFVVSERDLNNNPALKTLLESSAYKGKITEGSDGSIKVQAYAVIKQEIGDKEKIDGLKKADLRDLSEQLSNRSKVLNDLVNEKTVTYQDFSSKYDSTIEAMAKFIEKYFQVSSGLLNRFA